MAGLGFTQAEIGASLGIGVITLRKYYQFELDYGHIKANEAVAQSLYDKAVANNPNSVTAAIFWAKTRMGWKETTATENEHRIIIEVRHFTEDGKQPLEVAAAPPPKQLNGH
jgi:hypothetical protein